MKTIITLLIVGALSATSQASTNAVLCGIRVVETRDQLHPPRGKLGERGPYQFRSGTWRMHTSSSFDLAENRAVANIVAKRHYAWIEARLSAQGIEPSAYNVAVAWNAGVNAVIRGTAPAESYDYATRVLNIANTIADDTPKPARQAPKPWQAPILVAELSSSIPEQPVASPLASTPEAAKPQTYVLSTDYPIRNALIEVRYQSDPIMLAFSRSDVM